MIGALIVALGSPVFSQIPRTISYQGLLVSPSGIPISNAIHVLRISLYDAVGSAIPTFSESIPTLTKNGLFSVIIGEKNPIPQSVDFSSQYWLGVAVDGDAEMSPRTALTSVPYALHAEVAERAKYLSSDAKGVVTSINEVDGPIRIVGDSTAKVTQNGRVITISALPDGVQTIQNVDGTISIQNSSGPIVTLGVADTSITSRKLARNAVTTEKIENGAVTGDKINQMGALTNQILKWDGTRWSPGKDDTTAIKAGTGIVITQNASGDNVISTTLIGLPNGTTGATLRYDGNNWISNTFLYNDGARIGVGTTTPTSKMDIVGDVMLSNTGNASELRFAEPSLGGNHYTSFKSTTQSKTIDYTLPAALQPSDALLSVNSAGVMSWQTALPPSVSLSFSQITSGVNKSQNLQVGDSSNLHPIGTGIITANKLSGATQGGSSYAGRVPIPMGTTSLTVNLSPAVGCTTGSSVTISQFDAQGYNIIVGTMLTAIAQDNFTVQFSASYPTDTGYLTYLIVNP